MRSENGVLSETSSKIRKKIRTGKLKKGAEKLDDRVPSLRVFDVMSEGGGDSVLPAGTASLLHMSRRHLSAGSAEWSQRAETKGKERVPRFGGESDKRRARSAVTHRLTSTRADCRATRVT